MWCCQRGGIVLRWLVQSWLCLVREAKGLHLACVVTYDHQFRNPGVELDSLMTAEYFAEGMAALVALQVNGPYQDLPWRLTDVTVSTSPRWLKNRGRSSARSAEISSD